jgi:hypothetical protein
VDGTHYFSNTCQLDFLDTDEILLDLARPFGIFETPQSLSNGRKTQGFLVVV